MLRFKKKSSNKYKLNIIDFILLLALLLQDAGTFGFLPLNAFQIIIIFMGLVIFLYFLTNYKKISIPKNVFLLLLYMAFITIIFKSDYESFKGLGFFAINIVILSWYVKYVSDYRKVLKIIYLAATILAVYGLIQEAAYFAKIPAIYDTTLYGFTKNGSYITSFGMFRAVSLYAEPAHLNSIIAGGILIGLIGRREDYPFTNTTSTIIIAVFGILTASTIVYFSVLAVVFIYVFIYQKNVLKKVWWLFLIPIGGYAFITLNQGIMSVVYEKLGSLMTGNSTVTADLSAFAIYSNIGIAIEKMKDGYILGTGYDTHRLYYYKYIIKLYNSVIYYANVDEAASLYTRILSEFGIVGFVSYIVWLIKKLYKSIKTSDICMVVFVLILTIQGVRNGHYNYILTSLPFAAALNWKYLDEKVKNSKREKVSLSENYDEAN